MQHRLDQSQMVRDIAAMHVHYGFDPRIDAMGPETKFEHLQFRLKFLKEELDETVKASDLFNFDAEEIVDGLIDLMVVAIGTLDLFKIDTQKAWDTVHAANMSKRAGVKEGRPNPLGLPDLTKPEGWTAPSHEGNHGDLEEVERWTNTKAK